MSRFLLWASARSLCAIASIFVATVGISCDVRVSSTMTFRSLATHELQLPKADVRVLVDGILREAEVESRLNQDRVSVRWGTNLLHISVTGDSGLPLTKVEVLHDGPNWLAQDLFVRLDQASGVMSRPTDHVDDSLRWSINSQALDLWLRRTHGDPAPICDPWRNDALLRLPSDADGAALEQLVESGADLTRPMIVSFTMRFSGDEPAHRLARAAMLVGFSTVVEAQDEGWICSASKQMFVSYRLIEAAREELAELAAPDAGELVRWSTDGLPR